jgi:hypothetical protein
MHVVIAFVAGFIVAIVLDLVYAKRAKTIVQDVELNVVRSIESTESKLKGYIDSKLTPAAPTK